MAPDSGDDLELRRFVDHLQRSLVDGEAPLAEDPEELKNWIRNSRARLERLPAAVGSNATSLIDEYARLADEYSPQTELDSFHAQQIFEPVVTLVSRTCDELGIGPFRPVRLVNSPAVAPTALAWTSSDASAEHLLFVGVGTSLFCNYWGKAFADLLTVLSTEAMPSRLDEVDCHSLLQSRRHLLALPVRLAVLFAFRQTLAGFGVVDQQASAVGYRIELVQAMEIFIVAHEFSHFIIEERKRIGSTSRAGSAEEEHEADALAFALCRNVGSRNKNWLAFSGVASLAFFHALQICERARAICTGQDSHSGGHPPTGERLAAMQMMISQSTHVDELGRVTAYTSEFEAGIKALSEAISAELEQISAEIRSDATPHDTTAV